MARANEPDGSAILDSAGDSNSGGYRNPTADNLMAKLPSGGYPALYAHENYLAQQLPVLWMP
jgi:peptide/nickel transport system substrate-binding protein